GGPGPRQGGAAAGRGHGRARGPDGAGGGPREGGDRDPRDAGRPGAGARGSPGGERGDRDPQLRARAAPRPRGRGRQERQPGGRTGNALVRTRAPESAMIGITPHPSGTLADKAMALMASRPLDAMTIATEVLGLPGAPVAVAERLAAALLGADPRVRQQPDGCWALVSAAQGAPLLEECAFAVVDVETTGMRPGDDDRITEIAVVVVQGARRELVFDSLVNPGRPIPHRISELTGISQAMVDGAPAFGEIADQLLQALAGRVFVAHNARFDWGFVGAEVRRARDLALDGPRLCTVRLARRLCRGEPSYGL